MCNIKICPHKSNLISQEKSSRHIKDLKHIDNNTKINKILFTLFDLKISRSKIKFCCYLVLPFSIIDCLVPLNENVFSDSEIAKRMTLKRTTATKIVVHRKK